MATINLGSIDVPDQYEDDCKVCLGEIFGYQEFVPNPAFDSEQPEDPDTNPREIDNPQAPLAYVKQEVISEVVRRVKARKRAEAATAAIALVDTDDVTAS